MPFQYDPLLKGSGYRDTDTGRLISRASVGEQINVMISVSSNVTLVLAEMVTGGTIDPQSWYTAMREEIKSNYISQYLVGIGGRGQMTQADWGSVGGMIADQYRYLDGFRDEIEAGTLSLEQINFRSGMYINSSREGYERARFRTARGRGFTQYWWLNDPGAATCEDCIFLDGLGWVPIDEELVSPSTGKGTLPGMGDTICLTNCHCEIQYR